MQILVALNDQMSLYGELVAPVNSSRAEGEPHPETLNVSVNSNKSNKLANPQFKPIIRGAVPRALTSAAKHVHPPTSFTEISSVPSILNSNVNIHQSNYGQLSEFHQHVPPSSNQSHNIQQGEPDPEHELIDALAPPQSAPLLSSRAPIEYEVIHSSQSDRESTCSSSPSTPGSLGPGAPPPDWELINAKSEIDDFYDPKNPNLYVEKIVVDSRHPSQQQQSRASHTDSAPHLNRRDVTSSNAQRERRSQEIVIDDSDAPEAPVYPPSNRTYPVQAAQNARSADHAYRAEHVREREPVRDSTYDRVSIPERIPDSRDNNRHDRFSDAPSHQPNQRDRFSYHDGHMDDRSRSDGRRHVDEIPPRNADPYERYSSRSNVARDERVYRDDRSTSSRTDSIYDSRRHSADDGYSRRSRHRDSQAQSSSSSSSATRDRDRVPVDPTRLIILSNICELGIVDSELEQRIKQECSKYGKVRECRASSRDGSSTMYIKFMSLDDAIEAQKILNGKFFLGRNLFCEFGKD